MHGRWRRGALVLVTMLLLGVPAAATSGEAAPSGPDALRGDLDKILADPRLDGAHAGVVVRDLDTHQLLYSRLGNGRAIPASNAKLLTSAAALESLGPDYRFRTDVSTTATQRGDVLDGDLYLRGTGDPTVLAADYQRLADQVANAGVRHVRGRLVSDHTWFDDDTLGAGWAWDDESAYYAAPVSALTVAPDTDYDAGSVIVRVTPGAAPGQPVTVALNPPTSVLTVDNRAVTGPANSASTLSVQRDHATNRVEVTGSLPGSAQPDQEYISVPNPPSYAADIFTRALAARGVQVEGAGSGPIPAGARVLAARESMPLSQLLVPFLKLSNNSHAEALVKAMGRQVRGQGSWPAGLGVVTDKVAGLGVDARALRAVDGSGLSTMDVVPPDQLTNLLDHARSRPWFGAWYQALPIAGAPDRMVGGTLRGRMAGTPAQNNVHAKTGSMTGVTSLSGYVRAANGHQLAFSLLFNNFLSDAPDDLQDAVAVRLAQYAGAADQSRPRESGPTPQQRPNQRGSTLECSWVKAC